MLSVIISCTTGPGTSFLRKVRWKDITFLAGRKADSSFSRASMTLNTRTVNHEHIARLCAKDSNSILGYRPGIQSPLLP